jgi:hypothetical protein
MVIAWPSYGFYAEEERHQRAPWLTVAGHGRRSGWLRDPVIIAVHIDPLGPQLDSVRS